MISLPYFDSKQSDLFLREVLATTPSAVVGESRDGKIVIVNPRFMELTGWEGPCDRKTVDDLVAVWASRVMEPQALESYFRSCRSPSPPSGIVELHPNPGQVVQAQFRALKGGDGSPYRVWSFHEWRTSALAWVSHEIKNPLNAVLGFSELLSETLESSTPSESVRESLRGLRIGAKHLQSVLGDLLDLSRLESGLVEPVPRWTLLAQFIQDLGDLFRTRFRRRGLEFLVQIPEDPTLELWLDPGRLAQILGNFLSNALRFTKRGWVTLNVSRFEEGWEFSVEDSGIGIPLDQQKTIFEPFVQKQGQDSHKFGGTGLGLAICRTLAQTMGARLNLASTPGTGSRFSVIFQHLESREEPVDHENPSSADLPGTSILVADDERSNHLLVKGYLRGANVTVLSAYDGLEAIQMWKDHHPPVVLMDLRMPGKSGVEAAREIHALDDRQECRLLGMSATRMHDLETIEGHNLWSGFLEKPFSKGDLLKFLANHLTFVDESSTKP